MNPLVFEYISSSSNVAEKRNGSLVENEENQVENSKHDSINLVKKQKEESPCRKTPTKTTSAVNKNLNLLKKIR